MILAGSVDSEMLKNGVQRLRGPQDKEPDASIVIPVEAQGDMDNLIINVNGIVQYKGRHTFEIVPVINNYPPDKPPTEIELLRSMGINVVALPDARIKGEIVGFSARIPGLRAARSENTIHVDADCRIGDPTKLLDHYVQELSSGVDLSYTPVLFFDLADDLCVRMVIGVHYMARWVKRNILGIPTARGSNYAIKRSLLLSMHETGKLTEDIYVGKNAKALGAKISYCGDKQLGVYTSGRIFKPGFRWALGYLRQRIGFHWKYLGDNSVAQAIKDKN